jgi:hypothetical protein
MSFVKIATPTKTTVEELFTLGVSTSRGTENIGQFGSGTLMSTILWLRLYGKSPTYYVNGERVTFKTETAQKSDGNFYDKIVMLRRPADGKRAKSAEMSVSLEYGEKDWTEAGMAMREWISNAIDQGGDLSSISVVDEIHPGDGVEVYVPRTPEVRAYMEDLSSYFLHGKADQGSKTLPKDSTAPMRAYRRGVFIRSFEDKPSMFDYNLDFDISENRNGSSDSMEREIRWIIRGFGYRNPQYYQTIWNAVLAGSTAYEVQCLADYEDLTGDWKEILGKETRKVYPISAAVLGLEGMEGTPVRDVWYSFAIQINPKLDGMAKCGAGAKKGFKPEPVTEGPIFDMMVRLHNAIWGCGLDNGKTDLPKLEIYTTSDGSDPEVRGYYDEDTDTVGIYKGCQTDQRVMLEELAHRCSGHADRTRKFQDYLVALASNAIGETDLFA